MSSRFDDLDVKLFEIAFQASGEESGVKWKNYPVCFGGLECGAVLGKRTVSNAFWMVEKGKPFCWKILTRFLYPLPDWHRWFSLEELEI